MTLNCSTNTAVNLQQIMHYSEDIAQEDVMYPWLANGCMTDHNEFENDIPSDALDAMADQAYEQEQAMRESVPEEWLGVDKSIHTLPNVHF